MNESITIQVQSEEYETINVELSVEEVQALYKLRKENATRILELDKLLKDTQNNYKYACEARDEAKAELEQAHTLLSALGIADKTEAEESYYRKALHISTRIALFIAKGMKQ